MYAEGVSLNLLPTLLLWLHLVGKPGRSVKLSINALLTGEPCKESQGTPRKCEEHVWWWFWDGDYALRVMLAPTHSPASTKINSNHYTKGTMEVKNLTDRAVWLGGKALDGGCGGGNDEKLLEEKYQEKGTAEKSGEREQTPHHG